MGVLFNDLCVSLGIPHMLATAVVRDQSVDDGGLLFVNHEVFLHAWVVAAFVGPRGSQVHLAAANAVLDVLSFLAKADVVSGGFEVIHGGTPGWVFLLGFGLRGDKTPQVLQESHSSWVPLGYAGGEMAPKAKQKACKNCGGTIPPSVLIGGVRKKLHPRKYCLDCSPWGGRNSQQLEKIRKDGMKTCVICGVDVDFAHFPKKSAKCKPCYNAEIRIKKARIKAKAVNYLGGCCSQCGYSKCLAALEFHHVDGNKEFEISRKKLSDFEALKVELDKCIVLCDRCHTEHHAGEEQYEWQKHLATSQEGQ